MIQVNEAIVERSNIIFKDESIGSLIGSLERDYSDNAYIVNLLNEIRGEVLDLGGILYDDSDKCFLSEIIVEEKPTFKRNNLIISPSGSGKSTLIKDVFLDPKEKGRFLWLTFEQEEMSMTYRNLKENLKEDSDFINKFSYILCDDFNMFLKYQNDNLTKEVLFKNYSDKQIFYFTNNKEQFLKSTEKRDFSFETLDYMKHKEIKMYVEINKKEIKTLEGLDEFFDETPITKDSKRNYKGIAIGDNYEELMWLEVYTKDNGVRPICLWTKEDSDKKLSAEQAKVLKYIQEHKRIPFEYDIIILSKNAMKLLEIDDNKLKYAIISKDHDEDNILKGNRHLINLVVHEDDYHVDELL